LAACRGNNENMFGTGRSQRAAASLNYSSCTLKFTHTHCHNLNMLVEHPFWLWTWNKRCNIHHYSFTVSAE